MPINDYASLKLAIGDWLYRATDPDIDAKSAQFIELAESRIRRNQEWFTQLYSLVNGGNPLAATANPTQLPATIKQITSIFAASSTYKHEITLVTIPEWRSLAATNGDAAGIPTKAVFVPQILSLGGFLDDVGGVATGPQLFLWPQPTGTDGFAVDFQFVVDVPPLDAVVNKTNPLLRRHPDLYLYGALAESAPFYQHDERLPLWEGRYQMAVKEVNTEMERAKFSATPKRPRFRPLN